MREKKKGKTEEHKHRNPNRLSIQSFFECTTITQTTEMSIKEDKAAINALLHTIFKSYSTK